ncbi:unnamed protein product, partial [Chrysoparadoxa australica]
SGLRPDGRRRGDIRRLRCKLGVCRDADGSCYLEMGQTKVLAIVKGPHEPNRRGGGAQLNMPLINCEFNAAPFMGSERKKRRPSDRSSMDVAMSVKAVFDAAIVSELYRRTQIDIYLHMLQDGGGRLCASINAASLAIVNAGIGMQDLVVSCSAGHVEGVSILDLNHQEQRFDGPYLPVAILPRSEQIVLAKMQSRFALELYEELLKAAVEGCQEVYKIIKAEVREHA